MKRFHQVKKNRNIQQINKVESVYGIVDIF
jgi:hypothetical protein